MNCATGTIAPYTPTTDMPWDKRRVKHLYRRLAYGANYNQIQAALAMNPSDLVDQFIDNALAQPLSPSPNWYDWTRWPIDDYTDFGDEAYTHRKEWVGQLFQECLDNGFREKLTLFWHNHFVTQFPAYECSAHLYKYHKLLQEYSLGNFRHFAHYMGITPAMLLFLNGNENEDGSPNENYARELLELFTLGHDNGYTEDDIVEMARALTGWRTEKWKCEPAYFDAAYFDNSNKTIFGQTGNWRNDADPEHPDNVVNLIFDQRTDNIAEYICTKLYKFYISHEIDADIVAEMATTFKNNDFEIAPVLRQLFKSEHFFDDANIGNLFKAPVDYMIMMYHEMHLDYDTERLEGFHWATAGIGQDIFKPVNVAGWQGQRDWINENTLTKRWQYNEWYIRWPSDSEKTMWVNLAKNLTNDSNDVNLVVNSLVDYVLPNGLFTPEEYGIAISVFKGPIPENYYNDGSWNLNWQEVANQVEALFYYLASLPEYQLT